jgi:hypothetical protein
MSRNRMAEFELLRMNLSDHSAGTANRAYYQSPPGGVYDTASTLSLFWETGKDLELTLVSFQLEGTLQLSMTLSICVGLSIVQMIYHISSLVGVA